MTSTSTSTSTAQGPDSRCVVGGRSELCLCPTSGPVHTTPLVCPSPTVRLYMQLYFGVGSHAAERPSAVLPGRCASGHLRRRVRPCWGRTPLPGTGRGGWACSTGWRRGRGAVRGVGVGNATPKACRLLPVVTTAARGPAGPHTAQALSRMRWRAPRSAGTEHIAPPVSAATTHSSAASAALRLTRLTCGQTSAKSDIMARVARRSAASLYSVESTPAASAKPWRVCE